VCSTDFEKCIKVDFIKKCFSFVGAEEFMGWPVVAGSVEVVLELRKMVDDFVESCVAQEGEDWWQWQWGLSF